MRMSVVFAALFIFFFLSTFVGNKLLQQDCLAFSNLLKARQGEAR